MAPLSLRCLVPVVRSCLKSYIHTRRNFRTSSVFNVGAYDGDGQTTVTVLNTDFHQNILIDTVNEVGFRLNTGAQIIGPMVLFNRAIFSWNVARDMDLSKDSLSLFLHLEPKLDVLIVGLNDFKTNHLNLIPVINEVKKVCNLEVLPCERAIAAFNFLSSEGRMVAAALLPPKKVTFTDTDRDLSVLRKKDLYDIELFDFSKK